MRAGVLRRQEGRRLGHGTAGSVARSMARGDGSPPVGVQQACVSAAYGCRVRPPSGDPWLAGCHGVGIHGVARVETRRSRGHAGVRGRCRQHRGGWPIGQRSGGAQVCQRAPWMGVLRARQRALANAGIWGRDPAGPRVPALGARHAWAPRPRRDGRRPCPTRCPRWEPWRPRDRPAWRFRHAGDHRTGLLQ